MSFPKVVHGSTPDFIGNCVQFGNCLSAKASYTLRFLKEVKYADVVHQ